MGCREIQLAYPWKIWGYYNGDTDQKPFPGDCSWEELEPLEKVGGDGMEVKELYQRSEEFLRGDSGGKWPVVKN